MRHVKVPIFRFSELSEKARERVKQLHMECFGYERADEALASLKALTAYFGGKLADWSIDWFDGSYSSAKFDMNDGDNREDLSEEEIERRLAELGGDCPLTGYFFDDAVIAAFRAAWDAGERDLGRIMQKVFRSWLKVAQENCTFLYSDEVFGEGCMDSEFYVDGRLVDKAGVEYLDEEAPDAG